jgi:hypothetical protein
VPLPPADSSPNSAFIDDPDVISDKRLDSPNLLPPERGLQWRRLTFRHNFNFDASKGEPTVGFDGGVLEISFDGGNTFQDIVAAGGTFVGGGYNRTIATDRGSPIAGRQAWSGGSDGFVTVTVDSTGNVFVSESAVADGERYKWLQRRLARGQCHCTRVRQRAAAHSEAVSNSALSSDASAATLAR